MVEVCLTSTIGIMALLVITCCSEVNDVEYCGSQAKHSDFIVLEERESKLTSYNQS